MFLGLDLGTTNVKSLVVDPGGSIVAQGSAPVTRSTTPDGGVEQDIDQIWEATCRAIRGAVERLIEQRRAQASRELGSQTHMGGELLEGVPVR